MTIGIKEVSLLLPSEILGINNDTSFFVVFSEMDERRASRKGCEESRLK